MKVVRYLSVFICFVCFVTIGEGCKNGSFDTNPPDPNPIGPIVVADIGTDSFEVTQSLVDPKVDILLVIDTSGSMDHHQQKLAERFGNLVAGLSTSELSIDWQMAFINADDSDPEVEADGYHGRFYNLEDADGEVEVAGEKVSILTADLSGDSDYLQQIFLNTINRGDKTDREGSYDENGVFVKEDSGIEVPLRNIKNAIAKRGNENSGFFREDSTLVTIILSNEDELSNGQAKDGVEPTDASEVIQAVSDAFGSDKRFVSYGIIIKPEDTACRDSEESRSGRQSPTYGSFIHELSAKTYSICEEDYSNILLDIGSHLEASLTLSSIPLRFGNVIANSVKLTFTPAENEQSGSFDVSSNTYIFDEKPANGTTIKIEYKYNRRAL